MKRKLSRTTLVLVFFSLTLILSVAGLFAVFSIFRPSYFISAHKINYVPERQVLLENPDSLTLEAINNGRSSDFYSYNDTNFYAIYRKAQDDFGFKPFFFEYNNSFYDMGMVAVDSISPGGLAIVLLLLIVASIVAMLIIGVQKATQHTKIR